MNGWFGFGNARVKLNADIPKVGWIVRSLALDCATNQQIDFILTRQRQFLKLSGIDKLHKLRGNQPRKTHYYLQIILANFKVLVK